MSGKSSNRNGHVKVHVAIIDVENCAPSLVQGVEFYKSVCDEQSVPELMHANVGDYHISDIEFTEAFVTGKNIQVSLSRG